MATTSSLDRLYSLLTAKTGINRTRDVRLEGIAADRALEMRYQQGLTFESNDPIVHQPDQLKARVYPWQTDQGTTENSLWHYYPPSWVDPIDAAVEATLPDGTLVGWWNSPIHKQQLLNARYTTWGHGLHYEDVEDGARRWYFITVFATDMEPLVQEFVTMPAGKHIGFHLTADGQVVHKTSRTIRGDRLVPIDDRMNVPGRGPMVHMVSNPMNTRWISDEAVRWDD